MLPSRNDAMITISHLLTGHKVRQMLYRISRVNAYILFAAIM